MSVRASAMARRAARACEGAARRRGAIVFMQSGCRTGADWMPTKFGRLAFERRPFYTPAHDRGASSVSLLRIYLRVLGLLAPEKGLAILLAFANLALAGVYFLEPWL